MKNSENGNEPIGSNDYYKILCMLLLFWIVEGVIKENVQSI